MERGKRVAILMTSAISFNHLMRGQLEYLRSEGATLDFYSGGPENELRASVWFDDVSHADLTQHDTMAADDLIGLTSTVSSFVVLDEQVRADLLRRLRALLPEQVDVRRDLVVHRAVRNRVPVD